MQVGYQTLISLLLPDFILDFFELKEEDIFHLELQEVNITPNVPDGGKLLSKGFFPAITVQDFPIRGHKVFLHIKTEGFAAFLKEISRYQPELGPYCRWLLWGKRENPAA
jgi:hypothetical protein